MFTRGKKTQRILILLLKGRIIIRDRGKIGRLDCLCRGFKNSKEV